LDSSYTNFYIINSSKKSVVRKFSRVCLEFLEENCIEFEEISDETDKKLFLLTKELSSSTKPMASLRCRVSHGIYNQINYLYFKERKNNDEIDLFSMLACVLDDGGKDFLKIKENNQKSKFLRLPFTWENISKLSEKNIRPFTAKIILNFNDSISKINTWIANQVKSNFELKSYFKSCGLFLISPWALINNTSLKRVKEAWNSYDSDVMTLEKVETLYKSYVINYQQAKSKYKEETGRIIGWKPDSNFLNSLKPKQKTFKNLLLLDSAIRSYMSPSKRLKDFLPYKEELNPEIKENNAEVEYDSKNINFISYTINESARSVLKDALNEEQKKWDKDPNRQSCWLLYAKGLSQRKIAEKCGHKQSWVSKILKENLLIENIVLKTAIELKKYPDFKNLRKDPKAIDNVLSLLKKNISSKENSLLKTLIKEII
tara:strand:- start:1139 stop:2428 length:1290 start_codon:yes stop_codon:yes gene_type:complete